MNNNSNLTFPLANIVPVLASYQVSSAGNQGIELPFRGSRDRQADERQSSSNTLPTSISSHG